MLTARPTSAPCTAGAPSVPRPCREKNSPARCSAKASLGAHFVSLGGEAAPSVDAMGRRRDWVSTFVAALCLCASGSSAASRAPGDGLTSLRCDASFQVSIAEPSGNQTVTQAHLFALSTVFEPEGLLGASVIAGGDAWECASRRAPAGACLVCFPPRAGAFRPDLLVRATRCRGCGALTAPLRGLAPFRLTRAPSILADLPPSSSRPPSRPITITVRFKFAQEVIASHWSPNAGRTRRSTWLHSLRTPRRRARSSQPWKTRSFTQDCTKWAR